MNAEQILVCVGVPVWLATVAGVAYALLRKQPDGKDSERDEQRSESARRHTEWANAMINRHDKWQKEIRETIEKIQGKK